MFSESNLLSWLGVGRGWGGGGMICDPGIVTVKDRSKLRLHDM